MCAANIGEVDIASKALVVAVGRHPCSQLPQRMESADAEAGDATITRIGTVRAGDAEHLRPEIRAEIIPGCFLVHSGEADVPVDDEPASASIGRADGDDLHERVADARAPAAEGVPPAAPSAGAPKTSASIALYLPQSWWFEVRFQLIFTTKLSRIILCVPAET